MRQEAPEVQFTHAYREAIQAAGHPEVNAVRQMVLGLLASQPAEEDATLLNDPKLEPLRDFIRTALLTNKPLDWLTGDILLKAYEVLEEIDVDALVAELEAKMGKIVSDTHISLNLIRAAEKFTKILDEIRAICRGLNLSEDQFEEIVISLLEGTITQE